jgi:predicted DNA-binding transcriptional regulator YafY
MELWDERNALERAMLHFSHLEKETVRLDGNKYQIKLRYDREDETELLIRVLSFGPMLKVISPDSFIENLKERLQKQTKFRG